MNTSQKLFVNGLVVVVALSLAGGMLTFVASSRVSNMETLADINTFSWLNMASGLLFVVALIMSIVTLRYGSRHKAAIQEHAIVSLLLKVYRILFWLACVATLLIIAFSIWLGLHIGPVR